MSKKGYAQDKRAGRKVMRGRTRRAMLRQSRELFQLLMELRRIQRK